MNKICVRIVLLVAFVAFVTTSYGQKPSKKTEKARKNLKQAELDLRIADENLMIAQVDSIVQLEKAQKKIAAKKDTLKQKGKRQLQKK